MIRFGPLSFVLLLGAVQGLVSVFMLLRTRQNREANRFLAALTFILTLKLVPYIIGYAGFYDAYPWLDHAPFDLTLGIGPLLYLYFHRLFQGEVHEWWQAHVVPLVAQLSVGFALFVQPLEFKERFGNGPEDVLNQVEGAFVIISLTAYLVATYRLFRSYERKATGPYTDLSAAQLRFLRLTFWSLAATMALFALSILIGRFIWPISYFQMFPLYLLLTAVVYGVGLGAWRYASIELPPISEISGDQATDFPSLAVKVAAEFERLEMWRDPLLSLHLVAKEMGMSEARFSKVINQGLGLSFSEWVNTHRVNAVLERLEDPAETREIGEIAASCGFNSKASFNRWFRQIAGKTPSEIRASTTRV